MLDLRSKNSAAIERQARHVRAKIRQQLRVRSLTPTTYVGATSASSPSSASAPTAFREQCSKASDLRPTGPSARMKQMTTRDFKVFLEPDDDYGGYVVVCPSLPGCYSQGKTVSEALANIREAIDLCLEDMESRGEEIPDPNNVLIGSVVVSR